MKKTDQKCNNKNNNNHEDLKLDCIWPVNVSYKQQREIEREKLYHKDFRPLVY